MPACDDCGDPAMRRRHCHHCEQMVCNWCWQHVHQCEPSHTKAECRDLKPKEKKKC